MRSILMTGNILEEAKAALGIGLIRSAHAIRRTEEEDIALKEVKEALAEPELVEDY